MPSAPQARSAPTAPAWTVRGWYEPLDGDATALVRPYLRAYEREEAERARQWWRGGLLWGTYDVGPGTSDAQRAGAAA
ncbi:hypothetical protein ACGF5F_21970 [Streptomyces sp. NPDC047821]|uniref:hypothetical protein n=1 Tax=Streptomyces sp. NPDC047821 TaxID=3365488 RepID=UPI0037147A15